MKKILIFIAAIVILVVAVIAARSQPKLEENMDTHVAASTTTQTTIADAKPSNLGTYQYECDEHVAFAMTPASNMATIHVAPVSGAYPPDSTLMKKTADSGVRYEGNGVIFTAKGETITLGEGDSAINCSPVQIPDMAPFNFGD